MNFVPVPNPAENIWPYGYWQPVSSGVRNVTNMHAVINVVSQTVQLVVWVHRKCAKKHGVIGGWRHTKGKQSCYYCRKPIRGRKCGHPDTVEEGSACSFYPDAPAKTAA